MAIQNRATLFVAALLLGACGSGDSGGGGGGASFGDISDAISSPTGTVSAETAPAIADEFAKINQGAGGSAAKQSGSQEMACPAGGKMSITAHSSGGSARSQISYKECCYQAGCCLNGGGNWFFSTGAGAAYSYCGSYSLKSSCGGSGVASLNYEGCFDSRGWVYSIKVDGETFAVSGTYSNGNGTLEVKGENGSFSCTYTNGSGSCTGSSGNFSF